MNLNARLARLEDSAFRDADAQFLPLLRLVNSIHQRYETPDTDADFCRLREEMDLLKLSCLTEPERLQARQVAARHRMDAELLFVYADMVTGLFMGYLYGEASRQLQSEHPPCVEDLEAHIGEIEPLPSETKEQTVHRKAAWVQGLEIPSGPIVEQAIRTANRWREDDPFFHTSQIAGGRRTL